MGISELLLIAIGLSMDAFAVSICKGLASGKSSTGAMLKCGLWFGGFQALMPLIGYYLGSLFAEVIQAMDHWVAFVLLVIIGVNMLREAFSEEKRDIEKDADFSVPIMLTMAVATSIDALAVGISLAMAGNTNIFLAITLIGLITCLISAAGVRIGSAFGNRYQKKAQIAGGVILILIGLRILLSHLGVI